MCHFRGVPVTLDAGQGKAGKRAPENADDMHIQASQDAISATLTVCRGNQVRVYQKSLEMILALQPKINGLTSEMVARRGFAYYVKLN